MTTGVTQAPANALSIRIAANFTIEPIEDFLSYWMKTLRIPYEIRIAPYNQIFQQFLEGGLLQSNRSGVNLIALDLDAWLSADAPAASQPRLDRAISDLLSLLRLSGNSGTGGALLIFPPARTTGDQAEAVAVAKARLRKECESITGWSALDLAESVILYGVSEPRDPFTNELGNIPFTEDMYVAAATAAARWIRAGCSSPKKAIVLDCDQTLWQGVYGEGTMQVTPPYRKLQEFMLRQREQGMLLALASKNDEAAVMTALEAGSCVLRAAHCAAWQINWQPKSKSLQTLAETLGLALSSFIFVDDNPVECMEVRNGCPEVMTIQLPSDSNAIPAFLDHMWVFDHFGATEEDRNRAAMYAAERQRSELSKQTLTTEEFLASLQIQIEFARCAESDLARVAQLTHRTTQFNMNPTQHTEQSLSSLLANGRHECWTVRVKDVFGDYGLVGVALFEVADRTLRMEVFLMSCRALGRRVEHQIVDKLKQWAIERGADRIVIPVVPTSRNRPAREFLASLCGMSPDAQEPFECVLSAKSDASEWRRTEASAPVPPGKESTRKKLPVITDEEGTLAKIANEMQSVASILSAIRNGKKPRPSSAGQLAPPTDWIEERLVIIWSEVLGIEPIGIRDNFFELGGQSLLAVWVLTRVRAELSVELSLTFFDDLFKTPTIEALAQTIRPLLHKRMAVETSAIVASKMRSGVPLSISQEALWYQYQLDPGSPAYNLPLVSHLHGKLDPEALEKALVSLVDRHELLRSVIVTLEGTPLLLQLKKWRGALEQSDLRHWSNEDRAVEAKRVIRQEAAKPFDLSRDPMLRCALIRLTHDEWLFLHNSPHIVTDGGSQLVFYRELSALYNDYVVGKDPQLPQLAFQFADFAAWQRRVLQGEYLNSLTEYWKQRLLGSRPVEMPLDFERPAINRFQGTRHFFEIPGELLAQANAFVRMNGTTAYRFFYSAFNVFLYCYTGRLDLSVGSPVAPMNPACRGIEDLIGYFVNTLVLRMDLSRNPSFREVIRRSADVLHGAVAHSDLPLIKVAEALRLSRDPSRTPLFQINFRVLMQPLPALQFKGVSAGPPEYVDTGTSKFDLALEIEPTIGKTCYFEYRTDLFNEKTIVGMEKDFQILLSGLLAAPDAPIFALPEVAQISRHLKIEVSRSG
jgi:FkbH-like protein